MAHYLLARVTRERHGELSVDYRVVLSAAHFRMIFTHAIKGQFSFFSQIDQSLRGEPILITSCCTVAAAAAGRCTLSDSVEEALSNVNASHANTLMML